MTLYKLHDVRRAAFRTSGLHSFVADTFTQRQWYTIVILCQGTTPTHLLYMIPSPKDFESIHRNHDQVSRRLRSGGGGLRAELRSECLGQPPPLLPDFAREPLNPKKETGVDVGPGSWW